ncbi:MAG: ABC transporter ATP-binding protein [Rikenellaceae bacterium]|nr:ABC transporter ATP-binding protein [Rikenellaceae bacterium]MCL2693205.1 ABC transporter ATP-binding protein [Rikenellaceae bacterium]
MKNSILVVDHLSHRYTTQWAIRDINFEITRSGVLGLLGSNGAGKSTTMNIICGVLSQTEGEVYINGIDLKKHPEQAKMHIGFLPQKPPLHPDLTIDEYLHHCAGLRRMPGSEIRRSVEEAKERCGIAHFSKRLLRNLSGGYQQRVGIAQAIIHSPALVVLDEPTNGLDPNQIVEIRKLIKHIAEDRAVLLSTHILSEVQATCDRINMIEHGHLVFSGSLGEFDNQIIPDTLIAVFAGTPPMEAVGKVDGVRRIVELSGNRLRVYYNNEQPVSHRIIEESVRHKWDMTEINVERSSLDAIFAKLSGKEIVE